MAPIAMGNSTMTSEVGEVYKHLKCNRQNKRRQNLKTSTAIVDDAEVQYKSYSNGVHLVIEGKNALIDFWPSTGKFKTRDGYVGRGVYNMLRHCDVEEEKS